MKWSSHDLSWGRPLKSIVALFNNNKIDFSFYHLRSNNLTLVDGANEDKLVKIKNGQHSLSRKSDLKKICNTLNDLTDKINSN